MTALAQSLLGRRVRPNRAFAYAGTIVAVYRPGDADTHRLVVETDSGECNETRASLVALEPPPLVPVGHPR